MVDIDIPPSLSDTQGMTYVSPSVLDYPPLDYEVPNVDEHTTLVRAMRKACGWDSWSVPTWFAQQAEGTRVMAIFYLPGTKTPVGMGGIELEDFGAQDKDVADRETRRGCVVSLFLYKQYRGKGYLGRILTVCEELAKSKELTCLTIYGLAKAGGYERFGYRTFKTALRNYGGDNNWETRFLKKELL